MIRVVAANGANRAARRPFPLRQTSHPMKTRFLSAALAAMLLPAAAWAATETVDGVTYTFTVSGGAATITATDTGDVKAVNIPNTLGGAKVTTLRGGAFMNNTTVQKVVVPETVTTLTSYYSNSWYGVFYGCIALTSCTIPSGVTVIPDYCFRDCPKLRQIALPMGLKSIGTQAFYSCSSLEVPVFPEGLQSIGSSAFMNCSSFVNVVLPESVETIGESCFCQCKNLETMVFPSGLKTVPSKCFWYCENLRSVNIPDGVTSIGSGAFYFCGSVTVTIPASVTSMDIYGPIDRAVFLGRPPAGLDGARSISSVVYPREYGELWAVQVPISKFGGFVKPDRAEVTIVSADVRENDPTVLDVVYKVTSAKPTVKVRALAFEDGVRSFANVTRPETFIDGTAPADWDAVEANVEHTLSWKVAADFTTDLAKMKFEILAVEDGILPLELTTIPANGANRAMELSWNLLTESQVFDALLWLYADKTEGLTLVDGVLKNGNKTLANGSGIPGVSTGYYDGYTHYRNDSIPYVFSKMGFSKLDGDALTYANGLSRLGLDPGTHNNDYLRQYAYRWIEAE